MRQELSDRGFAQLTPTRLGRLINRARSRVDLTNVWSYRTTTTTSIASITDIGQVESVVNTTKNYPLEEVGYLDLVEWFNNLATTGSPKYWYRTNAGVATYPVTTDTITVRYWKVPPDLSADGDTPTAPARFHQLYVDVAQQFALSEQRDWEGAQTMQGHIDRSIGLMEDDLLPQFQPVHQAIDDDVDWHDG